MKIAVLYICTGKYEMFWDGFYKNCKEYFYPGVPKTFFVFTESKRIIEQKSKDVRCFYQIRTGWPYDTLLRFQWFMIVQDHLKEYDLCYYFNANSAFKGVINEQIIPFPNQDKPLLLWVHTRAEQDYTGEFAHPERNPLSTACVPSDTPCRCYGGGFFGGTSKAFIDMCCELRDNISKDLNNGIIAVWHDQSHLIHYGIGKDVQEVPFGIISEEEYIYDVNKVKMYFMAKSHYGGNDALRELSLSTRIKHMPKMIKGKLVNIAVRLKIDNILRIIFRK